MITDKHVVEAYKAKYAKADLNELKDKYKECEQAKKILDRVKLGLFAFAGGVIPGVFLLFVERGIQTYSTTANYAIWIIVFALIVLCGYAAAKMNQADDVIEIMLDSKMDALNQLHRAKRDVEN